MAQRVQKPPVHHPRGEGDVSAGAKHITTHAKWRQVLRLHWPILVILCGAAVLLFAELGEDYLWEDEGDTAVLAQNILSYGVPKAWDGVTFIVPDSGDRLNSDLVMVSHPWLQYYTAAASFLVFGVNTFAARFPFALAGWLTILALYLLVLRLTSDRRAAVSAALLLTLSVQFLLYARQCRNYSLYMLLVCGLLLVFFQLTNWRAGVGFAVLSALLFHCNPAGLAPLGALASLTLIYRPCRQYRRWFWLFLPLTLVLVGPWFLFAVPGYKANSVLSTDLRQLSVRLVQFVVECGSVLPVVGATLLLGYLWMRRSWRSRRAAASAPGARKQSARDTELRPLFTSGESSFLVMTGLVVLSYAVLLSFTQEAGVLWLFGLRYALPVIPLTMGATGILISKASGTSRSLGVALVLVLAGTNLGNLRPWFSGPAKPGNADGPSRVAIHLPADWETRIFKTTLPSFLRELYDQNYGTVAGISAFLEKHAQTNEVLITNYGWEALYFHTRLPQGLKVTPNFPIYAAAREHGLPAYVFCDADARWIVWRQAWEGHHNYKWHELYRLLTKHGATIKLVATVPETIWENRPNVHFHRFPGGEYKFRPSMSAGQPPALIYRVDWPQAAATPEP